MKILAIILILSSLNRTATVIRSSDLIEETSKRLVDKFYSEDFINPTFLSKICMITMLIDSLVGLLCGLFIFTL
jgi:hypothetical protein